MYVRSLGGEVVDGGSVTEVRVDQQPGLLERIQGAVDGRLVDCLTKVGVNVIQDGGRRHVLTVAAGHYCANCAPGIGDSQSLAT